MKRKKIIIVGAGLVGSLLAVYLRKRGHHVIIYERRGDMRKTGVEAGRSINLALSDRGLLALEKVGLEEAIKKVTIPMHGRAIHHADGTLSFQPYGKAGQSINSVSRTELNKKLMDLAEGVGVDIHFNEKCTAINWENNVIDFENQETKQTSGVQSDIIFGADGAFSASRLQHQLQYDRFDYNQYYTGSGYKELAIPAGKGGTFLLDKNALHIWPRKDYMLIALPNLDGSFTGTLFFPFEGELSFRSISGEIELDHFFKAAFPDLIVLIPDLHQQFFQHPVASLVTIKCFPWVRDQRFALIGDAAHAMVPFFGQGMNCGFEDCRILDELIGIYGDDWMAVLSEYQQSRKPDADAIADMALNNFVEMRDRTADPKFLLQKKIEARLHDKYPDRWVPAYTQVTFSPHTRYSEALKRGARQEAIMQEIMQMDNIETKWDSAEVEAMILGKL